MDYTVHINNGSMEASPIVLRLLPGEETGFDLKVINHGEPSNVSLEASDSLLKAVRLKRPDSYVASEESIPVRVRMPQKAKRLEGEILLTSSAGSSSVPISLLRESDDYGGDSMDKGPDGDEVEDGGAHEDEDEDEDRDAAGLEIDDEADDDVEGEVWKDKADGPSEAAEKIRFSREKDLERYRAASRSRSRTASAGSSVGASVGNSGLEDSGIGNSNYQGQEHPGDLSLSYDQKYLSHGNEKEEDEAKAYVDVDIDAGRTPAEEQTLGDRLHSFNWERGSMQIVPAVVLLSIIAALVLTFYTESLPLFAGALASSILIVTLIIYGAATLLKA